MRDVVVFPNAVVELVKFLSGEFPEAVVAASVPDTDYVACVTLRADVFEPNLVTRRANYTIECRWQDDEIAAAELGSKVAAELSAWARSGEDGSPYNWVLASLVDAYPDPDDQIPRSLVVCSLDWSPVGS